MADVDGLYSLPPEAFTAARNALAKELKAAGDRDGAAEVSKLRRPSVGAWALNQVAREHADLVEDALAAGERLRAASDAAAQGDASGLRAATTAERAAGHAVVEAARAHLGERSDALAPALLSTLRVAALDDDVAAHLRAGTLTTEHEQVGFGFGLDAGDSVVVPRRATKEPAAAKAPPKRPKLEAVPDLPAPDPGDRGRDEQARAEARAAERQRKKEHAAAVKQAERLEREAERLAKEASVAEAEATEARRAADDAMARAVEAREAATQLATR